jgi:hypothetical protein
MGCGCKNNSNDSQVTPKQVQPQIQQPSNSQKVNENVKDAIKKTIEKYYNVNKTTK